MFGQQLSPEQRAFMVLSYHETGSSPSHTRQAFAERFPNRQPLDKRTIIVRNFKKYERHATSHNRNKGNSGRPRVAGYDSHEKQNRKCLELQIGRKLKEEINVTKFRLVKYS